MGNSPSNLSPYLAGTNFLEERQIRRFEMTDLINQDSAEYLKKFSWIYPLICIDTDDSSTESFIDNVFKENFNFRILKFLQNEEYFKTNIEGKMSYDLKKIRILVFLLTTNTNDVNYSDKGSFLFSLIKDDPNDIMDDSVKIQSEQLAEFISILFEISCIKIYRFYIDEMQINLTNQIIKMQGVKERCIEEIYKKLFGLNKSTQTVFDAADPEKILELFKNKYFLTSGYIREIAFNLQADQGLVERPKKCCTIF